MPLMLRPCLVPGCPALVRHGRCQAHQLKDARTWCERLVRSLPVQHISPAGQPYLDRYFAAGWNPIEKQSGPSIFLHHFLASDPEHEVHSHPWGWSQSLIVAGAYREYRCSPTGHTVIREFHPGDVNTLEADAIHRIELLADDCWTVFLAGEFEQPWHGQGGDAVMATRTHYECGCYDSGEWYIPCEQHKNDPLVIYPDEADAMTDHPDDLTALIAETVAALKELRINANRLCDRQLGGTYEEDCRRSIERADAALAADALSRLAAGRREVSDIQPLDVTKLIDREGWDCATCGHRHAGRTLANICVGCPCREMPTTEEDAWVRIAAQNARDATARLNTALREGEADQWDHAARIIDERSAMFGWREFAEPLAMEFRKEATRRRQPTEEGK